jgi:D-3-phosphoglycerate dehydrogenase
MVALTKMETKSTKTVLITSTSFGKKVKLPLEMLQLKGCEIKFNDLGRPLKESELIEQLDGIDGCIAGLDDFTANVIRSCPRLKVISRYGSGLNNVDLAAAQECGVVVTNTPDANSDAVADLAVGLMLAVARKIVIGDQVVRQGRWDKLYGCSLSEKNVGIVGFGRIGRRVAERVKGFRCSVTVYDPFLDRYTAQRAKVELQNLDELLKTSDFISLHLPFTDDTRNLIGTSELEMMKPSAILINTSRGEIVDQDALLLALRSERLAGAGLDAYATEPPTSSLFDGLNNIVLTPHMGAYTDEALLKMGMDSVENLCDVFEGRRPRYLVAGKINE